MTDRVSRLTVILDRDTRSDDVQALIETIRQLRGVAAVEANVVNPGDYAARLRACMKAHGELLELARRLISP